MNARMAAAVSPVRGFPNCIRTSTDFHFWKIGEQGKIERHSSPDQSIA